MPSRFLERLSPWHLCVMIVITTLLVFGPHLGNRFVTLDDGLLIYNNPAAQEISIRSLRYAFTSYDPELYVPLTVISFQFTHLFFGLHPLGYHLVNLLLHCTSSVLLFWILLLLTRRKFLAFFCAMLFAIHPLQTEAVLWAAARKDVLSGTFFLLSIYLSLLFRREGRRSFFVWSIAAFALGLLSKVSIIMLPAVLLAIDWMERRPLDRAVGKEKIPYAILSLLFGIIAIVGKTQNIRSSGPLQTMLLAVRSTVFYLEKILWPTHLTVIYPQLGPVTLASSVFAVSVLVLLVLIVATMLLARRSRAACVALAFYLIMLLPNYTNFSKNGFLFFASDRYAYLPSIGIFALAAGGALALRERLGASMKASLTVVCALVIVALSGVTFAQGSTWRESEAMYRNSLAIYPQSVLVRNSLGDVLMKAGRREEAKEQFARALALDPTLQAGHVNMGSYFQQIGDFDDAIKEYAAAEALVDDRPSLSIDDLGAYYFLGGLYDQLGKTDLSIAQFRRAVEKAGKFAEPHYNLGLQYQKNGRTEEAMMEFRTAIKRQPDHIASHYHLAGIEAERGLLDDAIAELKIVLSLAPNYAEAEKHLREMEGMRR
ncbi:tetratricopeptide repeat protein [Candidatus Peregrinibacteria bacterium]|nr:tetratricopeptide repeat protein [Candidatus Peregrinibacteria bacterium]MBI3816944.1 tetratricopeptide repeat protein [Candidatus Peregrinibacteria bacterium]